MQVNSRNPRCHTPPMARPALILLFIGAALAACAPVAMPAATATVLPTAVPTTAPATQAVPQISTQDEIDIYAAVLRQLYGPDDTFGGKLQASTAYVIRQPNNAAGGVPASGARPPILPLGVQSGLAAALADLPTKIVWVNEFAEAPRDSQTGAVMANGAVFSVGGIASQPDGSVQVAGSIYVASLAAGGMTYVLEKQGARWVLTGNTGSQWIS